MDSNLRCHHRACGPKGGVPSHERIQHSRCTREKIMMKSWNASEEGYRELEEAKEGMDI